MAKEKLQDLKESTGISEYQERSIFEENFIKKFALLIVLLVAVSLIWKGLVYFGILPSWDFPKVSKNEWQAVFLTNDQVYFGHLRNLNKKYAVLTDVFYLKAGEPLQQGAPPQPAFTLVKLGGELHGPKDIMYIPKDKIMFWENMREDSQVVQAINQLAAQGQ